MVERGRRGLTVSVPPALLRVAQDQAGVVSRRQALDAGLSARQVDWRVRSGRWARLHPGIYVTHTGPPAAPGRVWAALLLAGPRAVAGGRTALALWGVLDAAPGAVTVCVPHDMTPAPAPGAAFARRRSLATARHPTVQPPRLRVEEAVLDVADAATRVTDVVDVVVRAVQRRLTTAPRLREALARRPRHRWRRLLGLVLEDVVVGVRSALEREYLRRVERAHGLPPGRYNPQESVVERRRERKRYRDVRYEVWALVVELDGDEAHAEEDRHDEHRRDNAVTRSGGASLRYGWRDVAAEPCLVAEEVAASLRARGWGGRPVPCSPACPLDSGDNDSGDDRPHPAVGDRPRWTGRQQSKPLTRRVSRTRAAAAPPRRSSPTGSGTP
ncbi:type IV toxin-antitoxin system AbiEi family antitoxin domain-containing protein [Kineosporia sp. R_H_3]|uniref:type IV toxin-antitoxin system AbiEi family antitoxin domain-containing protein n=1 Tax=Kineosporia sp. R_H_3 TaxID=1961848 RepID=UPI00117BBEFA|nr:type IV toxin-antitoxin system AbiEi family antitoxin domain-containing protein [Kineosporia sp. R_H_3]